MKTVVAIIGLLTAVAAYGQSGSLSGTIQAESHQLEAAATNTLRVERPNEIKRGHHTYSGILVQLAKTPNPLQLINPLAPPEAGSAQLNLAHDAITSRPEGWKLLAISF